MPKYSKLKMKRVLKHQGLNHRVANGVDGLVFLDYVLFIRRLAEELNNEAAAEGNGKGPIDEDMVERVLPRVLQRFRG